MGANSRASTRSSGGPGNAGDTSIAKSLSFFAKNSGHESR
jgi:hypothetical protein